MSKKKGEKTNIAHSRNGKAKTGNYKESESFTWKIEGKNLVGMREYLTRAVR